MTEAEWLACDHPASMIQFLRWESSERKWRLFAYHCVHRQAWHLLDYRGQEAVALSERFADSPVPEAEIERVSQAASAAFHTTHERRGKAAMKAANKALWLPCADLAITIARAIRDALDQPFRDAARQDQVNLLHDLFGNPFRQVTVDTGWLTWNDATIPALAVAIYEERAFDRLPILADALEDAGCAGADILRHLRGPGPHVRGCWAVDLLLGKE